LDSKTASSVFNSVYFLKLKLVSEHLAAQQRDAFVLAVRKGYYSFLKREFGRAGQTNGNFSFTFAEHLRKAEARLLPLLADSLSKTSF